MWLAGSSGKVNSAGPLSRPRESSCRHTPPTKAGSQRRLCKIISNIPSAFQPAAGLTALAGTGFEQIYGGGVIKGRFPCYSKVELSVSQREETITINYMEKLLSILRPKIQHPHDVFISFSTIKTLNCIQFYTKGNTLKFSSVCRMPWECAC